jgi:hypothetical protein
MIALLLAPCTFKILMCAWLGEKILGKLKILSRIRSPGHHGHFCSSAAAVVVQDQQDPPVKKHEARSQDTVRIVLLKEHCVVAISSVLIEQHASLID